MKKIALTLAFLGAPLTLIALTSHADTYTVSFLNPTGNTMAENVSADNNATTVECSGSCTSLPPNGKVIYTISSNELNMGTFAATFSYSEDSMHCDSGTEGTKIQYNEVTNYSSATNFTINVGEGLPSELYGSVNTTKSCAH